MGARAAGPAKRNFESYQGRRCDCIRQWRLLPIGGHLASAEAILRREANVVIGTGMLIEDEIKEPGFTAEHARERLAAIVTPEYVGSVRPDCGAYACNMLVRLASVDDNKIEFDETLPLYGWQADELSKANAHQGRQQF